MKRADTLPRPSAGLFALLLATPALGWAQAPATAPAAPPPAASPAASPPAASPPVAPPAAPAPASPATPEPAAPAAPATPAAPAAPAAPDVAPAAPASAAPPAGIQLAPDPKLAPAVQLAPEPTSFQADASNTLPDLSLTEHPSAALVPMIDLHLGFRDQLIASDSFDTFSDDDQLPAFLLAAGVCLHNLENGGALAGVASLELSGSSASLRGLPTELDVLRIGLGPELRVPVGEFVFLSGRLSPQAVHVSTQLDQSDLADLTFSDDQWTIGIDASLGADFRIAQVRPGGLERPLGVFLRVEAGYAWTPSMGLELTTGSGGPVRSAALPLGDLSLHGLTFGASLGLGY